MAQVNQGSRGLLIAWTVFTSILAVVATIMCIYFYVDSNRQRELLTTTTNQLNEVITPEMIRSQSDELDGLRAARTDTTRGLATSMKLFSVALAERDGLAKAIGGGDEVKARAAAGNALKAAQDAGAKAADSLSSAITLLVNQLSARNTEVANLKADSNAVKVQLTQTQEATGAQIQKITADMEQLRKERDDALEQLQTVTTQQRGGFDTAAAELRKLLDAANGQITDLNKTNADLGEANKGLTTQLERVLARLNDIRIDPNKAVTQQADGRIVRVPRDNVVFIDLGKSDQITAGMTFEVYDKSTGVPPPGDPTNETNLPIGKASIEVIDPGPVSSQCRVIRLSPGQALSEGDVIANLVYDRNTKYNFVVYGNFDLDQNGMATAQDAEAMKRLITQFGAKVVNEINVDTDFVLLGKEPSVPDRPKEDDPLLMADWVKAVAEADAYAEFSTKARSYRLPILNQNRFLYLVGYYEEAKR